MTVITLNVNGVNIPIKRQRLLGWMDKQEPNYMLPTINAL